MARKFKRILKCDVESGKTIKVYTSRKELENEGYSHNAIKVEISKQGGQALYKDFMWKSKDSMPCEEEGIECFNEKCEFRVDGHCISDDVPRIIGVEKEIQKILEKDKISEEPNTIESELPKEESELKQSEKSEDSGKKESKLKVVDKTITLKGEYETYIVTATGVTIQNSNEITFCNESDIENYRKNMISMINNKADEMLQALSYR